jgi:hypothetical protein
MRVLRQIVPHSSDPSLALVPLTRGMWATIDAAFSEQVGRFNWSASKPGGCKVFYARTNHDPLGRGRRGESLHRFVAALAGINVGVLVDHENGNGLDCRAANLRSATKATNARNRGIDRNNSTDVKGVHFESCTGRYRAEIWVDNRHLRLGRYDTLVEAEAVILAARKEYHGEFANAGRLAS